MDRPEDSTALTIGNDNMDMFSSKKKNETTPPPSDSGDMPPTLKVVPTIYATSPPLADSIANFWSAGESLNEVRCRIEPPEDPLAILEQLGPSPFPRGQFPLVGFLASTYDRVSRYALERG